MKTIYFRIISKKNNEVYQEGYVEIPDDVEESADWFYYDQTGMAQSRSFTRHDGVRIHPSFSQENEIDRFIELVEYEYVDWVNDVILNSEEDKYELCMLGDLIIEINGE